MAGTEDLATSSRCTSLRPISIHRLASKAFDSIVSGLTNDQIDMTAMQDSKERVFQYWDEYGRPGPGEATRVVG